MTAEGSPGAASGSGVKERGGDLDVEINAVEQWAREAGQVAGRSAGEQPRRQGLAAAASWKQARKLRDDRCRVREH
jgi:hypothetical protein